MNKTLLVHVVDSTADLDEEIESSVFTEVFLSPNQEKQVSFACKLESQVYCVLVFEARVKPAEVVVVELLLYPDFSD